STEVPGPVRGPFVEVADHVEEALRRFAFRLCSGRGDGLRNLIDARVLEFREDVVRLEVLLRWMLVAVIVAGSKLLGRPVRELSFLGSAARSDPFIIGAQPLARRGAGLRSLPL